MSMFSRNKKHERETAKAKKAMEAYSAKIRAEHAAYRAQILAMRPHWDAAKLEEVRASYANMSNDPSHGLWSIIEALKVADALEAKFSTGKAVV